MTAKQIEKKYDDKIDTLKGIEGLDPETQALLVGAMENKKKVDMRAHKAKRDRAVDKLFIQHFISGCPECQHTYKPTEEEIEAYLKFREASNMKI